MDVNGRQIWYRESQLNIALYFNPFFFFLCTDSRKGERWRDEKLGMN